MNHFGGVQVFLERIRKVLGSKPVGKIYHFISPKNLSESLKLSYLTPHGFNSPLTGELLYGISTTRNPVWKPEDDKYWDTVRITFDGTKISSNYKINSYNDFWKNSKFSEKKLKDAFYSQSEEKILTGKGGLKNFAKYIISIEFLDSVKPEIEDLGVLEHLQQKNIPSYFVQNFSKTLKYAFTENSRKD